MLCDYGGLILFLMLKVLKIFCFLRLLEIELNLEGLVDVDKGCVWIVFVVNIDVYFIV